MLPVQLPYSATGYFSALVTDYLSGSEKLAPFYRYPFSEDAFDQVIADRKQVFYAAKRQVLFDEISRQYSGLTTTAEVEANILSLREDNTFCIVTAHQLNIFTGPLYVLIKIANTVHICRQLALKYPAYKFVPVYMLGSEDHDFAEIATTQLFRQTITWSNEQQGPMGRYTTEGLLPLLEKIKDLLGHSPQAEEWCSIMASAYAKPTLAEATRHMVHALFGDTGLVCVDGDAAALKKQFTPVMLRELEEGFSYPILQATSVSLETAGYHSQLAGRTINLFYAKGHSRERIVRTAEGAYEVLNTSISFSPEAIRRELQDHPEHFSPNAVLRPLYQQTILPALAYVGGGGELAYWLQLKGVFDATDTFYPMLVLRSSLGFLSTAQVQRMEKLGISLERLFWDTEALKKYYIEQQVELDPFFRDVESRIDSLTRELQEVAASADPTLAGWAGAEGQKIKAILDGIEKRVNKAYKAKYDQALGQIEKLKEQVFPGGELQERVLNGGQWYARSGRAFIAQLLAVDPFQKQFTLLPEEQAG